VAALNPLFATLLRAGSVKALGVEAERSRPKPKETEVEGSRCGRSSFAGLRTAKRRFDRARDARFAQRL